MNSSNFHKIYNKSLNNQIYPNNLLNNIENPSNNIIDIKEPRSKNINSVLKNSENKSEFLGKKKENSNLISTNINSNLNSLNVDSFENIENEAMEKIKEKLELENKNYYDDNKVQILSFSNNDGKKKIF